MGVMSARKRPRPETHRFPAKAKTGCLAWRSNSTATDRGQHQNRRRKVSPTVAEIVNEKNVQLSTHNVL